VIKKRESWGDERDLLFTVGFSLPPRGRGGFDSSWRFLTCYLLHCSERCFVEIQEESTSDFHRNGLHYDAMPTARCATSRVLLTAWSQVVTLCIICFHIMKVFTWSFFDFSLSVLFYQCFVLVCHSFIYHRRYLTL